MLIRQLLQESRSVLWDDVKPESEWTDEVTVDQAGGNHNGFFVSPGGKLYDVSSSHEEWAQHNLRTSANGALEMGFTRVNIDQVVYWLAYRATRAQLRTIKDLAAYQGREVVRDREID